MTWRFDIHFSAKSEDELREKEGWLDKVFRPTAMRRTFTKETGDNAVIRFEDTGARHN